MMNPGAADAAFALLVIWEPALAVAGRIAMATMRASVASNLLMMAP